MGTLGKKVGIVVHDGYDGSIPNAYYTTRLGYLHGFQRIGLSTSYVKHAEIGGLDDGWLLWMTYDDFNHLGPYALERIKSLDIIVQVNVWFDGMEKVHADCGAPSPAISDLALERLLASTPRFVWCSAPRTDFYQGWKDAGLRVVSLPWAFDDAISVKGLAPVTKMAFVGGYRPYKDPQYETYLWPYEDILMVWGYSEWPKCYQGQLPHDLDVPLYSQALVCPTISEPQFTITGDTVERPFKILGAGGLTVFDCVPAYKDLFADDEALIPDTPQEYHEMIELCLYDPMFNHISRTLGQQAVLSRHTYAHRAQTILENL